MLVHYFLILVFQLFFVSTLYAGQILLYTSAPNQDIQRIIEQFNKEYPDITVNVFRSGTIEVQKKIIAEQHNGQVQADVIMISDHVVMEEIKQLGLLHQMASLIHSSLPLDSYDKDFCYFGTKRIHLVFFSQNNFNTNLKNWKQLVSDKKYSDFKIVIPNPNYSGAAKYMFQSLESKYGVNYVRELKSKAHMVVSNAQVIEMVAMRPQAIGIVVDFMAQRKAKNQSGFYVYTPTDLDIYISEPIAVVKTTKNENDAKKFVAFILSPKGQTVVQELGYSPLYMK